MLHVLAVVLMVLFALGWLGHRVNRKQAQLDELCLPLEPRTRKEIDADMRRLILSAQVLDR